MRCSALSVLAGVAVLASPPALAQDSTRIDVEYSFDNVSWAGGTATLATPTQPIYFRVRVSHSGPTTVFGLASTTLQPLFTRGTGGFPISLIPFPLSTADGSGVLDNTGLPAHLGRIIPFDSHPMTPASPSGVLSSLTGLYADEGVLRYAGANALDPELHSAWGTTFSQLPQPLAGTNFNASTNVVVFKCGASIQGTIQPILYYVDVPYALIHSSRDPVAWWYTSNVGSGLPRPFLVDPANIHPVTVWVGGNPCAGGSSGGYTRSPKNMTVRAGRRASFAPEVLDCGITGYQWTHDGFPLSNNPRIQGAQSKRLTIDNVSASDAGTYAITTQFPGGAQTRSAQLVVQCPADLDNGSGNGVPDQAVDINDLLFFLNAFEAGSPGADVDDGQGQGIGDAATDINDLLYFLVRFEVGC